MIDLSESLLASPIELLLLLQRNPQDLLLLSFRNTL